MFNFKKPLKTDLTGRKPDSDRSKAMHSDPSRNPVFGPGGIFDPNDTSSDPSFQHLLGNTWHKVVDLKNYCLRLVNVTYDTAEKIFQDALPICVADLSRSFLSEIIGRGGLLPTQLRIIHLISSGW